MTFGGYDYGPDDPDDDSGEMVHTRLGELVDDPDHPLSDEQCDHRNCKTATPGSGERICDECTLLMKAETSDRCHYCGETI